MATLSWVGDALIEIPDPEEIECIVEISIERPGSILR
jgi:hypothetical protein